MAAPFQALLAPSTLVMDVVEQTMRHPLQTHAPST